MKRLVGLVCALTLVGCGASTSNNLTSQSGPTTTAATNLSGRVVNEGGNGVAGVLVMARERTTDQGFATRSLADGTFQVNAAPGIYDLSFDLQGDTQTATCYYGPVDSTLTSRRDFVLRNRNGRTDDTVFGKIDLVPGTPASNRRLELRPGYARNFAAPVLPDSLATVTTQADGRFEVNLGHLKELGFDLEIFDGGGALDEWVKVDKSPKPCYVEVASEQVAAESLLRVNHTNTPIPPSKRLAGAIGPSINDPFQVVANANGGLSLVNGILPVQARTGYELEMIVRNPGDATSDFQKSILKSTIMLTGDVDFPFSIIYSYQINLMAPSKSNWEFTDETGDTYKLAVIITGRTHNLRYNSSGPKLLSIKASPR